MKIEDVQELMRTGHHFPPVPQVELLIYSNVKWDEESGHVFRTQLAGYSYVVAVTDEDHLKVLCLDNDSMLLVRISRSAEAQKATSLKHAKALFAREGSG